MMPQPIPNETAPAKTPQRLWATRSRLNVRTLLQWPNRWRSLACRLAPPARRAEQQRINAVALAADHLVDGLGTRSARGAAVFIMAQGAGILLQVANAALMARLLRPQDFGVAAMALAVTGLVGLFTDLGLSAASVQKRDLDQNTASALFFINVLCGVIAMMASFALAPAAAWFFGDIRVRWAIVGFGVIMPFAAAGVQHGALLARVMRWTAVQSIGILSLLVGTASGALAAALMNAGFWALIVSSSATVLTRLVLLWIACPWRPSRVRDWTGARSAVNFGLYLTGFNLTHFMGRQADVVMIGWYWGAAETGYYTRAYQLMLLPMNVISGPLGSVFIPALSRLQSDPSRWGDAFMRAYLCTSIIGCAFASVLIVTADHVIDLVYGPAWQPAVAIFKWLSWSMVCTFPMGAMAWAFVSLGQTKAMFRWGLISLAVLAIVFVLTVSAGAVAMARAFCIALWLLTPICFHLALRRSPVSTWHALVSILPLWISAAGAAFAGLSTKELGDLGPLPSLIVESVSTLLVFSALVALLIFQCSDYRRIATGVWQIATAALAARDRGAA